MEDEILQQLSENQQEYLEVIYELCKEHDHAHSKFIADKLNVKMSSVTDALQSLAKKKLINYRSRHPVTLTPLGLKMTKLLNSRQETLSDFFCNVLGFEEKYSVMSACKIEHIIDRKMEKRLRAFISALKCTSVVDEFKEKLKY